MKIYPTASAFALLALASSALAQDVGALDGAWTLEKHYRYPGTALFYFDQETPLGVRYSLKLIQREGAEIEVTNLEAEFDGQALLVRGSGAGNAGAVNALTGETGSDTDSYARYELAEPGKFDLHRLVYESGEIPGLRLPAELRRPTLATSPEDPKPWNRPVIAPAEWEQSEEILWGAQDAFKVMDIYAAAITGTHENGEVVDHRVYASSAQDMGYIRAYFAEEEVPLDRVYFHIKDFGSVWMRDFGPIVLREVVRDQDGSLTAGERRIVGDLGYYSDRPEDDSIPGQYAQARKWQKRNINSLKFEGGNFLTDGKGRIFTTGRTYQTGINPSQDHVEDRLRDLGATEVFFLERMPEPEGTGHIDMFAKLLDEDTVLVGSCDYPQPFAEVLDRNAKRLEAYGYDVIRVPMASGSRLMTYTNSLFVGKTVLVPTYNNSEKDAAALKIYRDAGWKPVGIDCRAVIKANGAIHCISMQIPK